MKWTPFSGPPPCLRNQPFSVIGERHHEAAKSEEVRSSLQGEGGARSAPGKGESRPDWQSVWSAPRTRRTVEEAATREGGCGVRSRRGGCTRCSASAGRVAEED